MDAPIGTNEVKHSKTLILTAYIHCLAQAVIVGTVVFYLEHLEKYFAFEHRGMKLPTFTEEAIHLRNALWLLPITFIVIGSWISARRKIDARSTSIFAACSILAIVCTISFAVLVTRAPFGYGILLKAPCACAPG